MSAAEYFQAIPFKHYLLAVKKIDPLQALEFLKRGLKIARGALQLQRLGNGALRLHFLPVSISTLQLEIGSFSSVGNRCKRRKEGARALS